MRHIAILALALLLLCPQSFQLSLRQKIAFAEGYTWPEENYPGTIGFPENDYDDLFYWWFPSRQSRANDPLVIWLNGGPGCSSMFGALMENGPFFLKYVAEEQYDLTHNPNSWNNQANLLYVDNPRGTGYSQANSEYLRKHSPEVSKDFMYFMLKWLERYPEFKGRPLFITGESFAGHYIPWIASDILKANNPDLNLKGIAIGNGFVSLAWQEQSYATFALHNNLITQT